MPSLRPGFSPRERIRRLRLYYKSFDLFRRAFTNSSRALWFPFFGNGEFFLAHLPASVRIPRDYWTMLPTVARLALAGARPEWAGDRLRISFDDVTLVSPPGGKMIGTSYKEIFVDDVYRIMNRDLTGVTVVDVGAYIGDSSIAFARRGARVHAFEPDPVFHRYLQDNIRLNRLEDRITAHPVGLSDRNISVGDIALVEAISYLRSCHITHADIVKMDCEGCEYDLFRDARLIEFLKPDDVILEYHRGGGLLRDFFVNLGFSVDWPERVDPVGYLYVQRDPR